MSSAPLKTAIIYDFDGTLARGNMQEVSFIPSIGMDIGAFWDEAEALTKAGIAIERSEVRLSGGPIRLVGEHHVKVHLHSDVEIDLPVHITAED